MFRRLSSHLPICANPKSLSRLSDDIQYVYDFLIKESNFVMSRESLAVIQQKILNETYVFSDLKMKSSSKEGLKHVIYLRCTCFISCVHKSLRPL